MQSHCTIFTLNAGINRAPWGLIYRTSPVGAVSEPSGGRAGLDVVVTTDDDRDVFFSVVWVLPPDSNPRGLDL